MAPPAGVGAAKALGCLEQQIVLAVLCKIVPSSGFGERGASVVWLIEINQNHPHRFPSCIIDRVGIASIVADPSPFHRPLCQDARRPIVLTEQEP